MSQRACILRDLKRGDKISPLSALRKYKCFRLASRIFELRGEGYNIVSKKRDQRGAKYNVYTLKASDK